MKETCWEDCLESKSSIGVSPDIAKSGSLVETAKGRAAFLDALYYEET